jgi:hypothetical protein
VLGGKRNTQAFRLGENSFYTEAQAGVEAISAPMLALFTWAENRKGLLTFLFCSCIVLFPKAMRSAFGNVTPDI